MFFSLDLCTLLFPHPYKWFFSFPKYVQNVVVCCLTALLLIKTTYAEKCFSVQILKWLNDRKTADVTIPWQGMSEGPECVVFNNHMSAYYVLEGAELTASSDSWAGSWACLIHEAWLHLDTPLGPGLVSTALRLPPSLWSIVVPHSLCFSRGINGPLLPLDEHSLMAVSLKADGPVWGGVSFTSLQLALARDSSGCLALLSCPYDGVPRGWNVCHLFYFQ